MIQRLSGIIGHLWEKDVTTAFGALFVLAGLSLYVVAPHYQVPWATINTAANSLISFGALLITPRNGK